MSLLQLFLYQRWVVWLTNGVWFKRAVCKRGQYILDSPERWMYLGACKLITCFFKVIQPTSWYWYWFAKGKISISLSLIDQNLNWNHLLCHNFTISNTAVMLEYKFSFLYVWLFLIIVNGSLIENNKPVFTSDTLVVFDQIISKWN